MFVIILCSNRFRCQPVQIDDAHLVADASNWAMSSSRAQDTIIKLRIATV
jgi:hypothetical protein